MENDFQHLIVIDPNSPFNGQVVNLSVENGIINSIESVEAETQLYVFPGLFDIGVFIGDPGFEDREDFHSAAVAAKAGGFTGLACLPNTHPVVDNKSAVKYIKNQKFHQDVDFYPLGCITTQCDGSNITEMIDMHESGAIGFTDGFKPIQNNGMMQRALEYVKAFDGIIINHPHDKSIAGGGQINEGKLSTMLGMKGLPILAEEMMIARDLELVRYTDSKIHISNISCAESVDRIRRAKSEGLKVSCSVAIHNLLYTEDVLEGFNTNFKLLPPLRTEADRKALIEGLVDGTIDCISSNHLPLEEEAKKLEFSHASFGATALETALSQSWSLLDEGLDANILIKAWSIHPRQILQLQAPSIKVGTAANLCVFDAGEKWTYSANTQLSKSNNSPLFGKELVGKAIATINQTS
ncbi:MAG: dihydroorotase [Bacteroidota bacterium]